MDSDDQTAVIPAGAARPSQASATLLPAPVAHAVSLATRSTSLAIRVGSLVSSYSLDAARFTTLSGLDLARGAVEGILSRASRDTASSSSSGARSKIAAQEAETILERSLEGLHFAVAQAVFWTSASFQLTTTTLSAASEVSHLMLASLDQLFGSTDSSRAIASIITLIRREFRNPATGVRREKVGVVDLVLALSALAYLQRQCRKSIEEERRRQSCEEVIWDVVVLNDGERVDVQDEAALVAAQPASRLDVGSSRPHSRTQSVRRGDDDEEVMSRLKTQIASSLPRGTTVSISSNISTVQTITVDVNGSHPLSLPTPPGAEIVAFKPQPAQEEGDQEQSASSYRVVYKIERNKFRATSFRHEEDTSEEESTPSAPELPSRPSVQLEGSPSPTSPTSDTSSFEDMSTVITPPAQLEPSTPPLPARPFQSTRSESNIFLSRPLSERKGDNAANQKKHRASLSRSASRESLEKPRHDSLPSRRLTTKKRTESSGPVKPADRKSGFKQVLKGSGQSLSNMLSKESPSTAAAIQAAKPKPQWKTVGGSSADKSARLKPPVYHGPSAPALRDPPRQGKQNPASIPRSSSRASYVSIHERRRDSIVSQTDSYSIHSHDGLRPVSPVLSRLDTAQDPVAMSRGETSPLSTWQSQRRLGSYAPSLYSLATNDSQSSLILSSYYQKSAFSASDALGTLRREGFVDGTFPGGNLLQNITRYMRFSSAAYGSHFLRFTGVSKDTPRMRDRRQHTSRYSALSTPYRVRARQYITGIVC